jgi:ribonuclease R
MGIKKKDILSLFKKSKKKELSFNDIKRHFNIKSKPRKKLMPILKAMAFDGKLIIKNDKFSVLEGIEESVVGDFIKAKDGYGFVVNKDGEDLHVSRHEVMWHGIMDGDKVRVIKKFDKVKKRVYAEFIDFISRRSKTIIGRLISHFGHFAILTRQGNETINIEKGRIKGARVGDIVEGKITSWPYKKSLAKGEVLKVIDLDIDLIIKDHNLRQDFPKEVLEKQKFLKEPSQNESDYKTDFIVDEKGAKRKNLSNILTFTIDGSDAKDFDDAISFEKKVNGFILYVSIADVSSYVFKNDVIDKEASLRTTSIYFPGFVIPMLPENISNNICSLKEDRYRHTMTAEIHYNTDANMSSYKIYPSVIKSKKRLNYHEVQKIINPKTKGLNKDTNIKNISKSIKDKILEMYEFYKILKEKSKKRGKLNLDIAEANIILDSKGDILNIEKRKTFSSHQIIEEFMIQANIVAAKKIKNSGIFRVHEEPSEEKMENFSKIAKNYNVSFDLNDYSSKKLSSFLDKIKEKPYEKLLNIMLLRSLKKAKYDNVNLGHYALSLNDYTHFTSPIRRYPDLLIHRLLKNSKAYQEKDLSFISENVSKGELTAQKAERDIIKIKQARFLEDKVGKSFEGNVSGFSLNAMFVELKTYFIEGRLSFSSIGKEFFIFNQSKMELVSENKKIKFKLGDKIKVVLKSVNVFSGEIDFIYKDLK